MTIVISIIHVFHFATHLPGCPQELTGVLVDDVNELKMTALWAAEAVLLRDGRQEDTY